ncbi:alpha/beta fold hydrolase [Microbulbifer sp. 2304DJ12-6]|uniref:alpha/beta fold hydrolase n=1 Tax=Microbulbifer sp. 2304DJ12-6 TaxID=3233340 RepID=UPI0039B12139
MKILLLPGLDGTGLLFRHLIEALPESLDLEAISFFDFPQSSYLEQAQRLAELFSDRQIFLVAESYSGRIAYELCSLMSGKIKGVVLIASFISPPSKVSRLAVPLCRYGIKPTRLNQWLANMVGFNGYGSRRQVHETFFALAKTQGEGLQERARNIAQLDIPIIKHTVPTTYIRPSRDHLVNRGAVNIIDALYCDLEIITLPGGHFIAQSKPAECARIIELAALSALSMRKKLPGLYGDRRLEGL